MILGEQTLRDNLWQLVRTPDPSMVNEASIDLRVGQSLMFEMPDGRWQEYDLTNHSEDNPLMVDPGEFILVATLEVVTMPLWCAGEVKIKSTPARKGWTHTTAGHVDPGWEGVLTMELKNISQYRLLPLYPGMRMCQMVVSMLDRQVGRGYHGKYQGATTVEEAKQ